MANRRIPTIALGLVVAALAGLAFDGHVAAQTAKSARGTKETPKPPVTPEIESEALNFIRQHHPELIELLSQLKSTNQNQYEQAVRDLSRSATMLATTEKNDPKKYVLDLKAWQANSQIQVLAARLAMSPSPELKEELRAKLLEQIDIRLEQQKLERERTEARLKRLDESIAKLEQSREAEAAKTFDKLTRTTTTPRKETKAVKAGEKPGASDKPKSTTPK
jgi:hypothetical protein